MIQTFATGGEVHNIMERYITGGCCLKYRIYRRVGTRVVIQTPIRPSIEHGFISRQTLKARD